MHIRVKIAELFMHGVQGRPPKPDSRPVPLRTSAVSDFKTAREHLVAGRLVLQTHETVKEHLVDGGKICRGYTDLPIAQA